MFILIFSLSPFSVKKCNHLDGSFDFVDGPSASTSISSSPFKLDDKSFVVPEYGKSLGSNTISSEPFLLFSKIEQPSNLSQTCDQTAVMGFCADMVTAHGDIVRRLRSMGFNLTHKQIHLDEVNYAVKSLNDLRDGTRITRVVEILFKGNPLSQKLRLPAISKLQKIHNVNLALTRISHHISIEGNINTRDIVNGHREKILSLFWQIIYKYLTPRYNNAASKIQNWWRNSSLKLVILKRIRIKQIAKRHSAATKIQARARGYLSRKHWPSLRTELVKNREMLHMASTTIKIYLKDKLKLLTEERKRFIILRRTVVLVQQIFRNKMAMVRERKKYLKTKRSALIIQKVFRGYILRKNFPRIKNDLIAEKTHRIAAVNTIKHAMRKNLPLTPDRLKLLKLKQTVIYVERLYIANRLMKLQRMYYTTLKITTVFIQRKFRANILMRKERENYLKAKHSALLIQKTFRGFIVRRHWTETRNHLISVKKLRFDAINKIKQAMRQNLPKTSDHLNFLKLKQTVLYVETLYIANESMRMQMENYNTLRNTTLFIQQQFKANRAMKKERKNYLKTKQSALLIQKMFRGFIVRKYWTDTKNCLILEKNKRIDAINRVKRTLRQNLPKTQDRLNFLELKTAVLFIQQLWRANRLMKMQRKCYLETRYAAVFIQRKFRAQIAMRTGRKNYLKAKESALLIQKMYRGYSARKKWPSVKIHLLMDKTKRIQAINIIKHVLRKNLSPTLEKQYYNKLKHFTVAIQRRFRANIAMKKQREEFELLKHSAVILQRRFRAKQCMVATRKWFISLKTVTIQLQSAVRGCLVRKQWPEFRDRLQTNRRRLIQSVNTIKRALRKGLPPTEDRLRFLELKQSVTVVQQRYRANVHSKRQKAKYLQIIKTVFGLQCAARGYLFRQKLWPTYRSSLLENRLRLAQCSNVIKRCLRQRLPMTEDRTAFLKLKTAAIVIQRRYRAHRAMNYYRYKYVVLRILTIQLQSMARGYVFRQFKWPAMKTEFIARRQLMIKCANTIKRSLGKRLTYCERNQFLKLRSAAVVVQRKFRTRCQARKYQKLRNSVLAVQRRFRANVLARQQWTKYNFIRSTVIIFQAYCRGCLVRRQWPETKHALLTHRKHLTVACNTIKKFIRLCLPTRPERLEYLKLRRAVLVVQTRYRALVLARLVQTKYLRLRQSTIVLQRHYRARRATLAAIVLQAHIRGYLARKQWPLLKNRLMTDRELAINALREKNNAASKIQAGVRGFLTRKRFPELKEQLIAEKRMYAATLIQSIWKGYCVRKKINCRRKTVLIPTKGALTLARRLNDVVDVLNKQKKNEYSYKELATVFWNLDVCTSLSKEICIKTAEGNIVDNIFRFLQYSNQSQPSIEAREPAIRVLINLLRYHETSWLIWTRVVSANMIKDLIKMMKTSCGKFGASKRLYCAISTWIWIAMQDPKKNLVIRTFPVAVVDFKYMKDVLNRRHKNPRVERKLMVLPSTCPTWYIGSKCQKCFESDVYAIAQICKMLNIRR